MNRILDDAHLNTVPYTNTESKRNMKLQPHHKLYPFQNDAINPWFKSNGRGTILIPTGGGNTIISIDIIRK